MAAKKTTANKSDNEKMVVTPTNIPTNKPVRKYPVLPDLPDNTVPLHTYQGLKLPGMVNWYNNFGPVFNQGEYGSCTAQSMCGIVNFYNPGFGPSQMFQYYNERLLSGTTNSDSGSTLGNAVKAFQEYGVCKETLWPYTQQDLFNQPPAICYEQAWKDPKLNYLKVPIQNNPNLVLQLKESLYLGNPVMIGIVVFPSFESDQAAQTGQIPMPSGKSKPLGGHAIVLVGYNDNIQSFVFRNSWGENWGVNGYGFLPYQYVQEYMMSAWVVS